MPTAGVIIKKMSVEKTRQQIVLTRRADETEIEFLTRAIKSEATGITGNKAIKNVKSDLKPTLPPSSPKLP